MHVAVNKLPIHKTKPKQSACCLVNSLYVRQTATHPRQQPLIAQVEIPPFLQLGVVRRGLDHSVHRNDLAIDDLERCGRRTVCERREECSLRDYDEEGHRGWRMWGEDLAGKVRV